MKPKELPNLEEIQFSEAFAIAKEALRHIGTFKTPPTPQVYELWFRYVEGSNPALSRELDSAVESCEVSEKSIADLYQRYFPPPVNLELHQRASATLTDEVQHIQSTLQKQFDVGEELHAALVVANDELTNEQHSFEALGECLTAVLLSSEAMQQQVASTNRRLEASEAQIKLLRHELLQSQKAILSDALTQIGNRRLFDSTVESIINNLDAQEDSTGLTAMILIDLDEFKRVNDGFGHIAGDDLLVYVASELRNRSEDSSIARIGGDEFAILQKFNSADQAVELAEDLRQHFSQQSMILHRTGQELGKVTLSIGIALVRAGDSRDSWYHRADQLLYASKNCGGNRVTIEPRTGR